jgi:hypothetical protein
MAIELVDADLGNGLAAIAAGLDEVLTAGLDPVDSPDAIDLIERLEVLGRRLDAARVDLVEVIDRKGLHRPDGHHSARVMVRRPARAHANPRVRDRLPEFEGPLLRIATGEPFKVFDEVVGDWVRLADEDGTCGQSASPMSTATSVPAGTSTAAGPMKAAADPWPGSRSRSTMVMPPPTSTSSAPMPSGGSMRSTPCACRPRRPNRGGATPLADGTP